MSDVLTSQPAESVEAPETAPESLPIREHREVFSPEGRQKAAEEVADDTPVDPSGIHSNENSERSRCSG